MWYVVDGMDGSGKSSIAEYLAKELVAKGRKVLIITHPNRDTLIGKKESDFLLQDGGYAKILATLLYILDVTHSIKIKKKNDRKKEYDDIIFVRYIMAVTYVPEPVSKLAYLFFTVIFPKPDVKILVDVDGITAMTRINSRGEALESFETIEQLTAIRSRMMNYVHDGWVVVNNNNSLEDSKNQIRQILEGLN